MLPQPKYDRLAASPLVVVVCQLRFEQHPEVSESRFMTAFHGVLGGPSGPYAHREQTQVSQITVTGAGTTLNSGDTGWNLRSDDGWTVAIMPSFVALETQRFTTWADFIERLETVVRAVDECVAPAIEQRLGVRFVDQLRDASVGSLAGWRGRVDDTLLGVALHATLGPIVRWSEQRLVLDFDDGTTCLLRHGSVPEHDELTYVLDFDAYREEGRAFDVNDVLTGAGALSDHAHSVFQQALTDTYYEALLTGTTS